MDFKGDGQKKYKKPVLIEHGDLKEITKGEKCCPPDQHGAGQS